MLVDLLGYIVLLCVAGVLMMAFLWAVGFTVAWWLGILGHALAPSPGVPGRGIHRPQVPPALRRAVLDRDGWACVICGSTEDLELDHEVPLSRGGATTYENLRVLCHPCNEEKGAK